MGKHMRVGTILVVVACSVLCSPARALDYCAEPSEPFCLSFGERDEYCRMEVERYLDDLETWVQCVAQAANDEAEAVIRKWNCKVDGNSYCF